MEMCQDLMTYLTWSALHNTCISLLGDTNNVLVRKFYTIIYTGETEWQKVMKDFPTFARVCARIKHTFNYRPKMAMFYLIMRRLETYPVFLYLNRNNWYLLLCNMKWSWIDDVYVQLEMECSATFQ